MAAIIKYSNQTDSQERENGVRSVCVCVCVCVCVLYVGQAVSIRHQYRVCVRPCVCVWGGRCVGVKQSVS